MKNNLKRIELFLLVFLMVGLITAGTISITIKDKDVMLEKPIKDELVIMKISVYSYKDFDVGDKVQRCLTKTITLEDNSTETILNTCQKFTKYYQNCSEYSNEEVNGLTLECLIWETLEYTNAEIEEQLDAWEKSRIEGLADASIKRKEITKEKTGEGDTTVKEVAKEIIK